MKIYKKKMKIDQILSKTCFPFSRHCLHRVKISQERRKKVVLLNSYRPSDPTLNRFPLP